MREVPKKRNTALQYKSDDKHCACRPIALLFRLHDYVYQTTRYEYELLNLALAHYRLERVA